MLNRGTQTRVNVDESFNKESIQMAYKKGTAGTGQPLVEYSKLAFLTDSLFALGSPLGLFLTCRFLNKFQKLFFMIFNLNHFAVFREYIHHSGITPICEHFSATKLKL